MTIPVLIRYFRGSDGRVDLDAIMTCMNMTIVPIVIMYLSYHKYIVKGVAAGAVKG